MRLKDFQSELVSQIEATLPTDRSVILQLPTGGGKTVIASALAMACRRRAKRIWFVCHRREIIGQTSRHLTELGTAHGVVAPGYARWPDWQVQVCSVDSLRRMFKTMAAPDLIIWDECHHIAAKSWSAMKEHFASSLHLGLTATPVRLDGVGLGESFNRIICGPSTRQLIEMGALSGFRIFAPTIPDLRGVGTRGGDYAKDALAERMSGPVLVGDVVDHYRRLAPDARAVVFAVSVEASENIAARFNAAGVAAKHVGGKTPASEREAAVSDLEAGRIKVLCNVEVFTEGFDLPAIDAVILMRPTKSLALYYQMIGRGLRPAPGKGKVIILDHAGLVYEHGLPDQEVEWSLDGAKVERAKPAAGERMRLCPECSSLHAFAWECAECGHEYTAADRGVEEVFGTLQEFSMPDGFERQSDFAKRIGYTTPAISQMIKRGLPISPERFVNISAAISWLEARNGARNKPPAGSKPGQFEPQISFASRSGISAQKIGSLIKEGLPAASNGWVEIEPAIAWIKANPVSDSTAKLPRGRGDVRFETQKNFAERVGIPFKSLSYLRDKGLPCAPNGWVEIDAAILWLKENEGSVLRRVAPLGARAGQYENIKDFSERVELSENAVRRAIRNGLPVASNGWVDIIAALEWLKINPVKTTIKSLPNGAQPGQFEDQVQFAKRLGIHQGSVSRWVRSGQLPTKNGWIEVEPASQWLREHKGIEVDRDAA